MTELENKSFRYTKRSMNIFKPNHEILYLYKNYVFNERVKDLIVLKYDAQDEKEDSSYFDIYPNLPKKLSIWNCFRFRKAIENFIFYQYSRYAGTFVERKILKDTKKDVFYIYEKQQYRYLLMMIIFGGLLSQSVSKLAIISGLGLLMYNFDTIGNIILLFNLNDILMKYQINTHFLLGKETIDFVNYLENKRNEENLTFLKNNKEYYDKFFVIDILDIKFEKGDKIVDYLKAESVYTDYHYSLLKKIENEMNDKNKKKL